MLELILHYQTLMDFLELDLYLMVGVKEQMVQHLITMLVIALEFLIT
jgi:hypothetical protein